MREAFANAIPLAIVITSMLYFAYLSTFYSNPINSLVLISIGSMLFSITLIGRAAYYRDYASKKPHSVFYAVVYTLFFVPVYVGYMILKKS